VSQTFILHKSDPARPRVLENAIAFLRMLPDGKAWQLTVEPYAKPRTDDQNAALWAVAYPPLMDFMGLRGDDARKQLHWFLCGEFFGWVDLPMGRKPRRTTTKDEHGKRSKVDTKTFADFYSFVQQKGAELGVFVPDPDPFWREAKAA